MSVQLIAYKLTARRYSRPVTQRHPGACKQLEGHKWHNSTAAALTPKSHFKALWHSRQFLLYLSRSATAR